MTITTISYGQKNIGTALKEFNQKFEAIHQEFISLQDDISANSKNKTLSAISNTGILERAKKRALSKTFQEKDGCFNSNDTMANIVGNRTTDDDNNTMNIVDKSGNEHVSLSDCQLLSEAISKRIEDCGLGSKTVTPLSYEERSFILLKVQLFSQDMKDLVDGLISTSKALGITGDVDEEESKDCHPYFSDIDSVDEDRPSAPYCDNTAERRTRKRNGRRRNNLTIMSLADKCMLPSDIDHLQDLCEDLHHKYFTVKKKLEESESQREEILFRLNSREDALRGLRGHFIRQITSCTLVNTNLAGSTNINRFASPTPLSTPLPPGSSPIPNQVFPINLPHCILNINNNNKTVDLNDSTSSSSEVAGHTTTLAFEHGELLTRNPSLGAISSSMSVTSHVVSPNYGTSQSLHAFEHRKQRDAVSVIPTRDAPLVAKFAGIPIDYLESLDIEMARRAAAHHLTTVDLKNTHREEIQKQKSHYLRMLDAKEREIIKMQIMFRNSLAALEGENVDKVSKFIDENEALRRDSANKELEVIRKHEALSDSRMNVMIADISQDYECRITSLEESLEAQNNALKEALAKLDKSSKRKLKLMNRITHLERMLDHVTVIENPYEYTRGRDLAKDEIERLKSESQRMVSTFTEEEAALKSKVDDLSEEVKEYNKELFRVRNLLKAASLNEKALLKSRAESRNMSRSNSNIQKNQKDVKHSAELAEMQTNMDSVYKVLAESNARIQTLEEDLNETIQIAKNDAKLAIYEADAMSKKSSQSSDIFEKSMEPQEMRNRNLDLLELKSESVKLSQDRPSGEQEETAATEKQISNLKNLLSTSESTCAILAKKVLDLQEHHGRNTISPTTVSCGVETDLVQVIADLNEHEDWSVASRFRGLGIRKQNKHGTHSSTDSCDLNINSTDTGIEKKVDSILNDFQLVLVPNDDTRASSGIAGDVTEILQPTTSHLELRTENALLRNRLTSLHSRLQFASKELAVDSHLLDDCVSEYGLSKEAVMHTIEPIVKAPNGAQSLLVGNNREKFGTCAIFVSRALSSAEKDTSFTSPKLVELEAIPLAFPSNISDIITQNRAFSKEIARRAALLKGLCRQMMSDGLPHCRGPPRPPNYMRGSRPQSACSPTTTQYKDGYYHMEAMSISTAPSRRSSKSQGVSDQRGGGFRITHRPQSAKLHNSGMPVGSRSVVCEIDDIGCYEDIPEDLSMHSAVINTGDDVFYGTQYGLNGGIEDSREAQMALRIQLSRASRSSVRRPYTANTVDGRSSVGYDEFSEPEENLPTHVRAIDLKAAKKDQLNPKRPESARTAGRYSSLSEKNGTTVRSRSQLHSFSSMSVTSSVGSANKAPRNYPKEHYSNTVWPCSSDALLSAATRKRIATKGLCRGNSRQSDVPPQSVASGPTIQIIAYEARDRHPIRQY